MTRHASSALDLHGPVSRDCTMVPSIPKSFVLADSLRRQIQLASQCGVGAYDLDGLSDGVLSVHDPKFGTFGSFRQGAIDTESFSAIRHASRMDIKKEFADRKVTRS